MKFLIRSRDMTKNVLFVLSMSLSPYVFPGTGYQETYVGFLFLNIPRLGKRHSCISELISVNVQC